MFLNFLEAHGADYGQVILCDIRDVIFQSDVFKPSAELTNWLGVATEADDIRGSKSGSRFNYNWLRDCFGAAEADKIADKKIICCGTVIGSSDAMEIYCRELWKIVGNNLNLVCDQAATNYLVWNGLLPIENVFELDVTDGEIFTAGLFNHFNTIEIRDDKILRGDGGVPSVVHQYDRNADLVRLVDRIYRDKNFEPDPRFDDARSLLEQTNQLLTLGKVDNAARFCMNTSPANFNGQSNRLLKIWQFVLQRPLTPAVGYLELWAQNALMSARNISVPQLNQICSTLIHADKNRRPFLPQLKIFLYQGLVNIIEQAINTKAAAPCFECIKIIETLDLPLNKDFYLLAAKVNRIFGRKTEAVAAYTKAVELD